MKEDKTFLYLSIYFIVVELFYLLSVFPSKMYPGIFWACNLVPIFFAFGFLTKNINLVKGTIFFDFLPQLIFVILTIIYFVTNVSIWNIKNCFSNPLDGFVALYLHLFSANIALFYTYKIKTQKKSLAYSAVVFLIVFLLTIMFTIPNQNVNYLHSTKILIGFDLPFSAFFWPFFVFLLLVIPTYLLQKFLVKKYLEFH